MYVTQWYIRSVFDVSSYTNTQLRDGHKILGKCTSSHRHTKLFMTSFKNVNTAYQATSK